MLLVDIKISYYSNSTLNSIVLEILSSHSCTENLVIKESKKVESLWEYIPTTSLKWESMQATFKHHQCASLRNLKFGAQNSKTPP